MTDHLVFITSGKVISHDGMVRNHVHGNRTAAEHFIHEALGQGIPASDLKCYRTKSKVEFTVALEKSDDQAS